MVLPLIVFCMYKILPICLEATGRVIWAALLGAHSVSFLFQYIDTALVSQWSASVGGPAEDASQHSESKSDRATAVTQVIGAWEQLRFGFYAAVSTRNVGTPYEVEGVPPFSSDNPDYVPSKGRFLFRKAIRLLICYMALDLGNVTSQPEQNHIVFHRSRVPLANPDNWSLDNLLVRLFSVLGFWASLYCVIELYMGLIAFVIVALDINKVKLWPPAFGPITEAYTVRRFWGIFWHKYQQQKMAKPAAYVTNRILRVPKSTLLSRYTSLFITFLISGYMHALTEIAQDIPWNNSGAVHFFCTQAIAIILEDGAQGIYRRISKPSSKDAVRSLAIYRWIGYLWTTIFLIWSTPIWIYPSLYENKGEEKDLTVPISIVRPLIRLWKPD